MKDVSRARDEQDDALEIYGTRLGSRLMLGTSKYDFPAILADAVRASAQRS